MRRQPAPIYFGEPLIMLSASRIEQYFEQVSPRMAELPAFNPLLRVSMLGWQQYSDQGWVGVLITPWCMNLLWQPAPERELPPKGSLLELSLPSGCYACVLHQDPELGYYASASLYSSMHDFGNFSAAQAVAEEVLRLIGAPPHSDEPQPLGRRDFFRRILGSSI